MTIGEFSWKLAIVISFSEISFYAFLRKTTGLSLFRIFHELESPACQVEARRAKTEG